MSQNSGGNGEYMPGQAYIPDEHPEKSHESTRSTQPLRDPQFVDQ
jgi:hypothetical protein